MKVLTNISKPLLVRIKCVRLPDIRGHSNEASVYLYTDCCYVNKPRCYGKKVIIRLSWRKCDGDLSLIQCVESLISFGTNELIKKGYTLYYLIYRKLS